MTCDEFESMSLLYIAGALDAEECGALKSHLDGGCPRCRTAVDRAEVEAAQMRMSLEPIQPPASVKRRLMARVRRSREARIRQERLSRRFRAAPWPMSSRVAVGMAAVLCLILGVIAGQQWGRAGRLSAELVKAGTAYSPDAATPAPMATALRSLLGSNSLTIVPLRSAGRAGQAWGRLLWDRQHHRCYLFSSHLGPTAKGAFYQLWFLTRDDQVVMAKSFRVPRGNPQEVVLSVSVQPGKLSDVAKARITLGRGRQDARQGFALLSGSVPPSR